LAFVVRGAGSIENYLPDYSAVTQGIVSKLVSKKKISHGSRVFIHKALVHILELQAMEGKATGLAGIEEIKRLSELSEKGEIQVEFVGSSLLRTRTIDQKSIQGLLRDTAIELGAILITGDKLAAETGKAMGLKVLYQPLRTPGELHLESFFDEETMSVHLIEDYYPVAKKGRPGEWRFVVIKEEKLSRLELERIVDEIIEAARAREDSFIEIDRSGSTIVQLGSYRIVISRPPLSSRWEVTAVRPLVKLSIEDYNIPEKLLKRLREKAEGILIAGAPGMGKTTFAQALAEYYSREGRVIKTIESPRDMRLPPQIVQYSKTFATQDELHDILLLSRPDYTFFDELRGDEDFRLYVDLRLAGIGMVGVMHATSPIDAIQRFIGRVELGVIPSIIDTVIFIENGSIKKVYEVSITVKLPTGLKEAELSRPVVEVKDYLTGQLEYEIYTFGEQTVVVPIKTRKRRTRESRIKKQLESLLPGAEVEVIDNTAVIRVPREEARLLTRRAKKLRKLSEKLGVDIRIETQ
jgi:ATPase